MKRAIPLYENSKVNLNHPDGDPRKPRSYQDRFGVIRNVLLRENEGLFADFQFNPKHAIAEQLLWDAQFAPENVGFSHNVEAVVRRNENRLIVDKIISVRSVDLVADPATTTGLFEGHSKCENGTVPKLSPISGQKNIGDSASEQKMANQPSASEIESKTISVSEISAENTLPSEELSETRFEHHHHNENLTPKMPCELCAKNVRSKKIFRTLIEQINRVFPECRIPFSETFFDLMENVDDEKILSQIIHERLQFMEQIRISTSAFSPKFTKWNIPEIKPIGREQYVSEDITKKDFVKLITR
ncbi:MAG: hypothetical protein ACRCUY_11360 [Thermoguttaceae bacterium]